MKIKKEYGNYRTDICPFCGKKAIFQNKVKLAVCKIHVNTEYPTLKWTDGQFVDVKRGKFGNYCESLRSGNIPLKKVLEFNGIDVE